MPTITTTAKTREVRIAGYTDRKTGIKYSSENTQTDILLGSNVRVLNENRSWKQQVAIGADASTNYSRSEWLMYRPPITYATGYDKWPAYGVDRTCQGYWIHTGSGLLTPFSGDDVETRDAALMKLKNRLRSHYGSTQSMAPLAELRELRTSIRGFTGMTTEFLHDLLSIRRTKGKSALKYAANAWLGFNFGAKPLVGEIAENIQAVENYLNRTDHRSRVSGKQKKEWVSSAKELNGAAMLSGGLDTYHEVKHTLSYQYAGAFTTSVEAANNYGVSDHFGLQWKELIPTFWELVPYSWAVDYFTSVGAYLNDTFEVPSGDLTYLYMNRLYTMSVRSRTEVRKYNYASYPPRYGVSSVNCIPGHYEYFSFSRTKLATLPHIGMRFKSADEIGFNAVNKLLNLASVLVSGRLR